MMQSSHSNSSQTSATNSPDDKILGDLSTLTEQISLCQSMLVNSGALSSIQTNEALLTVIGFLEACVPRMMELIEAAASGALKPETFEECLVVNDKLTNILADVEKDPKDRQPLTAAASASKESDTTNTDDVDEGMRKMSVTESNTGDAVVGGKTTGLDDDPFAGGPDLLEPTPVQAAPFTISDSLGSADSAPPPAAAAAPPTKTAEDDDDFDAFFRDRTSAP